MLLQECLERMYVQGQEVGGVRLPVLPVPQRIDLPAGIDDLISVPLVYLEPGVVATALEQPVNVVRDLVTNLRDEYDNASRGFELREVGGGWRLYVRADYDWAVRMFVANENPTKLSQAALETLAVIAYKQPISRGQVASIRAVNVDSVVRTLLSRGLITELYTDSETGATNFGTTELMLQLLGINSLDELPLISPFLPSAEDVQDE